MQYYATGGKSWLGMRSLSQGGVIEPVAGGSRTGGSARDDVRIFDQDNKVTAALADVRAVTLNLRGVTDERVQERRPVGAVDTLSMTTRVALRNALRP